MDSRDEEKLFDRDREFFRRLEQKAKENLINDIKNTDFGKQIHDYNSYIKKPSKFKIMMNKVKEFLNMI